VLRALRRVGAGALGLDAHGPAAAALQGVRADFSAATGAVVARVRLPEKL
jgi:hypothetical protein